MNLSFESPTVIVLSFVLNCQLGSKLGVCLQNSRESPFFSLPVKMASMQSILSRYKDLRGLCSRLTSLNLSKNVEQKEFLR